MKAMDRSAPITITESAFLRAKYLLSRADEPAEGVRIGIDTKGCSGFSYRVEYAYEHRKFEDVIERDGVKFFIDPTAVMYLLGSELDYEEGKMESGFVFTNPNETGRCGCGESFSATPKAVAPG
ncbi:MAG: HesB/IscA family protein [Rhodospirillaceae bacterium]